MGGLGVSGWDWAIFVGAVVVFLLLDLGVFHRKAHEVKFKEVTKVMSELDSVSIEVVKYDRGWWHSFAQTKVSLSPEYAKSIIDSMKELDANQKEILKTEGLSINFNHAIQHGPFIYAKSGDWKGLQLALALFHSEILLLDETKKIIEVTTGLNKLVDIEGKISIEGGIRT